MGSPMSLSPRQNFRLFRVFGITVFLHWSWFLVAAYELDQRSNRYPSLLWNLAEYLALFGIVLLHEFGHSLACRQVGGSAKEIVLWPLGGVAFVSPPSRPGAVLWSIAAGPLVNVVLVGVFSLIGFSIRHIDGLTLSTSAYHFLRQLSLMNLGLLIFNILPIYPLDGGQILRALLWFPLGRARSLTAAAVIGLVGATGLIALAIWAQSLWIGIMAFFILTRCWSGFKEAQQLGRIDKIPRHEEFACPSCQAKPLMAPAWLCSNCRQPFDTFRFGAVCPNCGQGCSLTACPECGQGHPMAAWRR